MSRFPVFIFLIVGFGLGWAGHSFYPQARLASVPTEEGEALPVATGSETPAVSPDSAGSSSVSATANVVNPGASSAASAPSEVSLAVCYEQMKPSHIEEWEKAWNRKVDAFLENNNRYWRSQTNWDANVMQTVLGRYAGRWSLGFAPQTQVDMEIHVNPNAEYKLVIKNPGEAPSAHTTCSSTFNADTGWGTDSAAKALNVLIHNCHRGAWPQFSEFAFKLPADLGMGESRRVVLSALDENFAWVDVGNIELVRRSRP